VDSKRGNKGQDLCAIGITLEEAAKGIVKSKFKNRKMRRLPGFKIRIQNALAPDAMVQENSAYEKKQLHMYAQVRLLDVQRKRADY
jgi:hypothetical protein